MKIFDIPILFLVFNRPDTTAKVFEKIREIRPAFLYIAADGPRQNNQSDSENIREVQSIIDNGIDWKCEVHKLYRTDNLGCGLAVSGAICWFFQNVEMGIILEDDTVPGKSFFYYCENLLHRYKDNVSIMHITGNSYAPLSTNGPDYFFTRLPFIWGWATWKRAWNKYDFSYRSMPLAQKKTIIEKAFRNKAIQDYWSHLLADFHLKPVSYTWDYQWFLSIWDNKGMVVQPKINLVQNIGFNSDATHTTQQDHHLAEVMAQEIYDLKFDEPAIVINEKQEAKNFQYYFLNNQKRGIKNTGSSFLRKLNPMNLVRKATAKVSIKLFPELSMLKNTNNGWNLIRSYAKDTPLGNQSKIYPPYHLDEVQVGDFTYIAQNAYIYNTDIGKFCSIGPNVFCGWGIHPVNGLSTAPMFYSTLRQNGITLANHNKIDEKKLVKIGNDVFIGANVTILDGVTIGDGAVIGAGAVVSKDIPPYAIAVGCPITVIKKRFTDNQIEKLLSIKWWDFKEEDLSEIEKHFFEIDAFITKYYKAKM